MSNQIRNTETDAELGVSTLDKTKTPRKFKVILLNDDFTPMDFVILVLQRFFNQNLDTAERITLEVHKKGAGLAGVYAQEVAEMKVSQVNQFARQNSHPLKCIMEEE